MISSNKISQTLFISASIIFMAACSQQDPAASTDEPTKSQQTDKIFAQWDNENSPGCLAFAFQDGEILMSKGYGMADMAWTQPITDDTVFYIASTAKQFTAAAIALLVLDGKLSLDDDVRKYIPELPEFDHTITVEHLVHHTSGLRDYFGLAGIAGRDDPMSNQKVLALISKQIDLNFKPGSEWSYSNSGYALMSMLVERVSGKSLGEFTKERIFDPLGMKNSQWDDKPERVVQKRARSYSKGDDGNWIRHPKTIAATGDGNLLITVGDLLRWDENFYTAKVGGKAFLDLILKPGPKIPEADMNYAFGLMVNDRYRGQKIVRHAGGFYGFRIELMRFPEQHFSSGVLCNAGDANSSLMARQIADVYIGDKLDPKEEPAKVTAPEKKPDEPAYDVAIGKLQEYIGTYHSPELDIDNRVKMVDGSLIYVGIGKEGLALTPVAEDKFVALFTFAPGMTFPITFDAARDSNNKVDRLILDMGRVKNFRLDKMN